jgi:hypothetical protein
MNGKNAFMHGRMGKMIKISTKRIRTGRSDMLSLEIPPTIRDRLAEMVRKSDAKHAGFLTVSFELPHRPRTTGEHSQNNLIHGWCRAIALALGYDEPMVYEAMKRMAVGNGYPTWQNPLDGKEEPRPMHYSSVEEASIVSQTIEVFAGEHGIILPETT